MDGPPEGPGTSSRTPLADRDGAEFGGEEETSLSAVKAILSIGPTAAAAPRRRCTCPSSSRRAGCQPLTLLPFCPVVARVLPDIRVEPDLQHEQF